MLEPQHQSYTGKNNHRHNLHKQRVVDVVAQPGAKQNAHYSRREELDKKLPVSVAVIVMYSKNVGHYQHRQHNTRGVLTAKQQCK